MATLAGNNLKDTFGNLLQVPNGNDGVDTTLRSVEDGKGDVSALQISTGAIQVGNINIASQTISSADTNGHIYINPNGTGEIKTSKNIESDGTITGDIVSNTVDINGGAIDGVTIGTNVAVSEFQVDNININGNTISSTDSNGDVSITPHGTGLFKVDNIGIDGNTIKSTDTDGHIYLTPNGSGMIYGSNVYIGDVLATNGTILVADINGGDIDGVTIGTNSAVTELQVDNINIDGNTISSSNVNGDLTLQANGTGKVEITSADDAPSLRVTGDDPDMDVNINSSSGSNLAEYRMSVDGTIKGHIAYDKSAGVGAVRIVTYGTDENINLAPNGNGKVRIGTPILSGAPSGSSMSIPIIGSDDNVYYIEVKPTAP